MALLPKGLKGANTMAFRLPKGLKVTTRRVIKLENGTTIEKGVKGTLVDEVSSGGHAVQFDDGEIDGLRGMMDITVGNLEPDIKSAAGLLKAMADEMNVDFQNADEATKQKYFTLKFTADTIEKLAWYDEHCSYLESKLEAICGIIDDYKRRQ